MTKEIFSLQSFIYCLQICFRKVHRELLGMNDADKIVLFLSFWFISALQLEVVQM